MVADCQISLALERESAGEEDSNTGNSPLHTKCSCKNVPGTDFQSLQTPRNV